MIVSSHLYEFYWSSYHHFKKLQQKGYSKVLTERETGIEPAPLSLGS